MGHLRTFPKYDTRNKSPIDHFVGPPIKTYVETYVDTSMIICTKKCRKIITEPKRKKENYMKKTEFCMFWFQNLFFEVIS